MSDRDCQSFFCSVLLELAAEGCPTSIPYTDADGNDRLVDIGLNPSRGAPDQGKWLIYDALRNPPEPFQARHRWRYTTDDWHHALTLFAQHVHEHVLPSLARD